MIQKVLIANRGEIAIRIMRACKEMGIATVAVYSEADRFAPHARYADEAFCIGPAASRDSYLRADILIETALKSGADAIHPGYGFLSERAEFSQAVTDAGLIFIGPPAAAISAMGSKTAARKRMKAAGVPVAPGVEEPVSDEKIALEIANDIGFPLLIKAAHGGGGKGMRKVFDRESLSAALSAAMRESQAAFNSTEVYLERFVENPHHIEIQILADRFGNTIHLGERECSIQRRHQKLVEESPSPFITNELRLAMGDAAVKAAQAVGYVNAGTVEFLVDAERNFYFLEMNTRLQVEHPITELVTGIDIVRQQLRIASGEALEHTQADVKQSGWAIECRICAEDPTENFLPSSGIVTHLHTPSGPGIRDDRGFEQGGEISTHYDSLLAKLIVWGEDRTIAIERMQRALSEYSIGGVQTTLPFFREVMHNEQFRSGDYNTSFIDTVYPDGFVSEIDDDLRKRLALVAALHSYTSGTNGANRSVTITQSSASAWKLSGRTRNLQRDHS